LAPLTAGAPASPIPGPSGASSRAPKTHACPDCGKVLVGKSGLERHLSTHSGERPYPCGEAGCNATFKRYQHLTKHSRTHTGERPHECSWADVLLAFAAKSDLTRHRRTHTGERPYVCKVAGCNAAFSDKSNLNVHNRTHAGERPNVCTVAGCTAAFQKKSDLMAHNRTHTGERPTLHGARGVVGRLNKVRISSGIVEPISLSCYLMAGFMSGCRLAGANLHPSVISDSRGRHASGVIHGPWIISPYIMLHLPSPSWTRVVWLCVTWCTGAQRLGKQHKHERRSGCSTQRGRAVEQWDSRLSIPALRRGYSLLGQVLATVSVDAGWRLVLSGQAGEPLNAWDSRGTRQDHQNDLLLRPLAVMEQAPGDAMHIVERFQ
jgi:hypothetical protein